MADGVVTTEEQARYLENIGIQAVIDGNKRIKVVPTNQQLPWTNTLFKLEELGLNTVTPFIYEQAQQQLAHIAKKLTQLNAQNVAQQLLALSPTQQEVDVLNAFISELPEQVKPLPIANALTWVIALNKYKNQNISELSEAEKVILISNVYSVVSVLDPQKVEGTVSLVLPAGLDVKGQKLESPKTYPSINVDKQVVQMIADLWVDLPIEMVSGFQDIHQEYQTILAELKQKADSQDSEKRAQRYMRFHDQYADAFTQMPTTSKIDMLQILSTGNDEGSKLKGQKLLDKASEYIAILDSWYTEENGVIVSKYNDFLTKFNYTSEQILSEILYSRLPKDALNLIYSDEFLAESEVRLAESEVRLAESEKLLKVLLTLKKESQIVTKAETDK